MKFSEPEDPLMTDLIDLPAGERDAFLNHTCGGDVVRRQRLVEALGRLNDSFSALGSGHSTAAPTSSLAIADALSAGLEAVEKPGTTIGRYTLLEKIGEGGCGIVYLAEQQQPMRRHVALKIIKLGMDTREFVARFEAERQALALMDHPNIARVFDAGATDTGRPYFVMEFVRGIPITRYCDENNLPTAARLRLFITVCQAVQHAHQKGVIHRDLKPSNILVTLHDGVPVPKIIDFGIAKATGAPADRENAVHPIPRLHRHTCLHESGADGDERSGRGYAQRHLQSRRAALRTAHRSAAVRSGGPGQVRSGGDAANRFAKSIRRRPLNS